MRVLCGTSIEHRIFMTIDIESVNGDAHSEDGPTTDGYPDPDENDVELIALASSRMLSYYALRGLPNAALTVRPVGAAVTDRRRYGATDLVLPLEGDESTLEERAVALDPQSYARRPPSSRFDMLVGRVPSTDLLIGMSRRLFAACRTLDQERAALQRFLGTRGVATAAGSPLDLPDEDAYEEQVQVLRAEFAGLESDSRDRILVATREAYEVGKQSDWRQLIEVQPTVVTDSSPGVLESATPDTYIAIDTGTPTLGA